MRPLYRVSFECRSTLFSLTLFLFLLFFRSRCFCHAPDCECQSVARFQETSVRRLSFEYVFGGELRGDSPRVSILKTGFIDQGNAVVSAVQTCRSTPTRWYDTSNPQFHRRRRLNADGHSVEKIMGNKLHRVRPCSGAQQPYRGQAMPVAVVPRSSLSHFVLVKVAGAMVRGKGITKRLRDAWPVAACARAPRSELYS